jgi:uncharacterized Ntn-hydrolase superfamily protein
MTFSVVACDLIADPPEWGVAVASKFPAVGAVVPWARAGAGAVATQAFANVAYGPDGLDALGKGRSATEVIELLTGADVGSADRQIGVVDAKGATSTFTGEGCFDWAGGVTGPLHCCQGNILVGPEVVEAMSRAFLDTEGELAERLLAALVAGDAAGGDKRGRQSAALLVVREGGGYGGGTDKTVDLRVDDHTDPVSELGRLLGVHRVVFPRPEDLRFLPIDDELRGELATLLEGAGYPVDPGAPDSLRRALEAYSGTENLEERLPEDRGAIEQGIIDHLRARKR